jgi:hypothetical protein
VGSLVTKKWIGGRKTSHAKLTKESASMIAKLIHTIHPLLPVAQSSVGPGAQPRDFASGESTA